MEVGNNYDAPSTVKIASTLGALIGTGIVTYALTRKQISNDTFIKKVQNLEIGIKDGIILGLASITGGFLGGITTDNPKHIPAKTKETSNQIIGNVLVPFSCLALVNNCTKKFQKPVRALFSISTLALTTFLGHAVADRINNCIFENKKRYKVGFKDFATDIDDVLFAASTVLHSKLLYKLTATICPFTYTSLGIMAGLRQENSEENLDIKA